MALWKVWARVESNSIEFDIEAETGDEAIEKANEQAQDIRDKDWLDGAPLSFEVETPTGEKLTTIKMDVSEQELRIIKKALGAVKMLIGGDDSPYEDSEEDEMAYWALCKKLGVE